MSLAASGSLVTLPLTFHAIGAAAPGAPFKPLTRTINTLAADEVLVRVSYAAINPMDAKIHQSNFVKLPLPMVLGFEFSGVVVALGTAGSYAGESEPITLGAAVFGQAFGFGWGGGAFGEYVVAKRERCILRGDLPEADASTYAIAYASAYETLFLTTGTSQPGQTIFIPGGSGAVGHFAVQLAKAYGLRVITSASKPEGLELLRKLHADVVIDYSVQDVVVEVLTATEHRGADIVYDCTYMTTSMKQSAAVVAKGGKWMRLGPWLLQPPEVKAAVETIVRSRGASMLLADLGRYTLDPAFAKIAGVVNDGLRLGKLLYAEGRVKPFVAETVPFEASAVQAAVLDVERGSVGKKVVKVL